MKTLWIFFVTLFHTNAFAGALRPQAAQRWFSKIQSFGRIGLGLAQRPFPTPEELDPVQSNITNPTIGSSPTQNIAPTNNFEYTFVTAQVGLEVPWSVGNLRAASGAKFTVLDPSSLLDLTGKGNKYGGQGGSALSAEVGTHVIGQWNNLIAHGSVLASYHKLLLLFRDLSDYDLALGGDIKWVPVEMAFWEVIPVLRASTYWIPPMSKFTTRDPTRKPPEVQAQEKKFNKKFSNSGTVQGVEFELETGVRFPSTQGHKDLVFGFQFSSKTYGNLISLTKTTDNITTTTLADGVSRSNCFYVSLMSEMIN